MQAFKSLVFIGLILGLYTPTVFGKLIWQDFSTGHSVSFSKYNTLTISATVPDSQKQSVLNALKNSFKDNVKFVVISDVMKDLDKMFSSSLLLHISSITTENPNINLLKIAATASSELNINKEYFKATIWERTYLFENDEQLDLDLRRALEEGIATFVSQYFKTNPEAKGKAIIYFFFNN